MHNEYAITFANGNVGYYDLDNTRDLTTQLVEIEDCDGIVVKVEAVV